MGGSDLCRTALSREGVGQFGHLLGGFVLFWLFGFSIGPPLSFRHDKLPSKITVLINKTGREENTLSAIAIQIGFGI